MKQPVYPLYAPEDAEAVRPVLAALSSRGVTVRKTDKPKRGDAVVFFLSAHVAEDSPAAAQFFALQAKTKTLIPVLLDGSTPPALIENALMARHRIVAERYSVDELAERITAVLVKKLPLAWILGLAAAALAVIAAMVLLINAQNAKKANVTAEPTASPVPTVPPRIPSDVGLTAEDLARVHHLFIIGDRFEVLYGDEGWVAENGWAKVDAEYYAQRIADAGEIHWLNNNTGSEIELHKWEDLDFLRYMTNLKFLDVICVEGTLPDLSGLRNLDFVRIADCKLTDLNGLADSRISALQFQSEALDFTPLNTCSRLTSVQLDLTGEAPEDLATFSPPTIQHLNLSAGSENGVKTASGLLNCRKLRELSLNDVRLTDLSCFAEATLLMNLQLYDLPALTSLNGIEGRTSLSEVTIDNCFALSDLSALSSCTGLRKFYGQDFDSSDVSFLSGCTSLWQLELQYMNSIRSLHGLEGHTSLSELTCDGLQNLTDISALSDCTGLSRVLFMGTFSLTNISPVVKLPQLRSLELYGVGIDNVNFLNDIANKEYFSFGVSEVADWTGLAAIQHYKYLNITVPDNRAFPYITDATVAVFELWYRRGNNNGSSVPIDYSLLPAVSNNVMLHGVPSLEGLPNWNVTRVRIDNSDYLTSLDGLENLKLIHNGFVVLDIGNCPFLTDWSALEGLSIDELNISGVFTLPTFRDLALKELRLESIVGCTDLSPVKNLNPDVTYHAIRLFDLDGVTDLSPLYGLHGKQLFVPAHLKQQADLLHESGNFDRVEIEYPDSWWQPYEPYIKLHSLDELDTMPSALLAYVQDLSIVGDRVFSWDESEFNGDWTTYPPTYTLTDRETGEEEIVPVGTLTDLSRLSVLTGLKSLSITNQAFTSLDGIQYLGKLERLQIDDCRELTDVSAAFTMQNLKDLQITNSPYTSIDGVQNLKNLQELKIWVTGVDSLEPVRTLKNLRYLNIRYTSVTDLSPLGDLHDDCEIEFNVNGMKVQEFLKLPDSVLAKIQELSIAGDWLYDGNDLWFDEDWSSNGTAGWLMNRYSDQRTPIGLGTVTDLSFLSRLPNLRTLRFACNPIETTDGIEALSELQCVELRACRKVTDVSALFKLSSLNRIDVSGTNAVSIAGIEQMPYLNDLNIGGTQVTDLSPLALLDKTEAMKNGDGFCLSIDNLSDRLDPEQYRILAAFPAFASLNVYNTDCSLWADALKNTKVYALHAGSCGFNNETFRVFVEQHPELRYINVPGTYTLTDVSPLLNAPNLERVCIARSMQQAIDSLGDTPFSFFLEIEG